jgi:chemotaxis protein MotB
MAIRRSRENRIDSSRWLTTYSDMMNNLLVLFMVLYSMSIMDLQKFEALATSLNSAFNKTEAVETVMFEKDGDQTVEQKESIAEEIDDSFDKIYEKIKKEISTRVTTG